MKKLIVFTMFFLTSLLADYEVFVTKTIYGVTGPEKEIFFGTLSDYSKAHTELMKKMAEKGTEGTIEGLSKGAEALAKGMIGEGLKYAGTGAAIGVVFAALDPYVMSLYADQEYILIKSIDNGKALKAVLFIGDKHPSLSEEKIHEILKNK